MKPHVFVLAVITVLMQLDAFPQCATGVLETKLGSGDDAKWGVTNCVGSGCAPTYYRGSSTSYKAIDDYTLGSWEGSFHYHVHSSGIWDGSTTFSKLTQTCPAVYTNITKSGLYVYWTKEKLVGGVSTFCTYEYDNGTTTEPVACNTEYYFDDWQSITYTTNIVACSTNVITESWYMDEGGYVHDVITETPSGGLTDEYTTGEMVGNAKNCMNTQLAGASFQAVDPSVNFTLSTNQAAVTISSAYWRVAIQGHQEGKTYLIRLIEQEVENGILIRVKTNEFKEKAPSSLIWYYPSESGNFLKPNEKYQCGYTDTISVSMLEDVMLIPDDGTPPTPCSGKTAVSKCSGGPNPRAAGSDNSDSSDFFDVDLGAGSSSPSLGILSMPRSGPASSSTTTANVRYVGAANDDAGFELVSYSDIIHQAITPTMLIDLTNFSSTGFSVRVMDVAAKGDWNGLTYDYDTSSAYVVKQIFVENPDGGGATNRIRVRELIGSTTNEWMYTYTSTNSGWNVALPGSSSSIDLTSTNHASNAYTLTTRYRDSSNNVIAQESQIYTNLSWGTALLQEISGTGSEARTRTYTYWDASPTNSNAPFTPRGSRAPIKSIEDMDGSWRYISQYTTNGLVQTELKGVDTTLTTDTNSAIRIEISYTSQHADDTLHRQPDSPRKVEEYWKGTLIKRTYHVYATNYHEIVECPNPTNAIGTSGNLITWTYYVPDTATVTNITYPDGTLLTHFISGDGLTETNEVGQASGGAVVNGTRTIEIHSENDAFTSRESWDITNSAVGVKIASEVRSNFDYLNRPQTVVRLGGFTNTMTYACCGMDSETDADGTVTSYGFDGNHREFLTTRWGISKQIVFDSASRPLETWRIGTNNTSIRQGASLYDTTSFVTAQTNALGGITTIARTKQTNGFDQIVTTYPDGGTNLQKLLANGRLERSVGNASAPRRYVYGVTNTTYQGVTRSLQFQMQIKLDSNGSDTGEWEVSCFDALGRPVKRILPGSAEYVTVYNDHGQQISQADPDGVIQLFRYNDKGEQIISAVDIDQDGYVDDFEGGQSGSDRVTSNISFYLVSGATGNSRGMDIRVDDTYVWTTISSAATSRVSRVETSTDGLYFWRTTYKDQSTPITAGSRMVYSSGGNRYLTNALPSGVTNITAYSYGRPVSVTEKNTSNSQITKTDIGYDSHGRKYTSTDARNGTTTFTYNNADQIATVTTPAPGTGQRAQVTSTSYDASMRATIITQPDGLVVTNEYSPLGVLKKTYGARIYPAEYTYDSQRRMTTMKTWQNYAGNSGTATTTWIYNTNRGWLDSKRYNDSTGPDYTYTSAGRLATRTWARTGTGGNRIITTYTNSTTHGDITGISYSNDPASTPAVTYTYDRRGRRTGISSSTDAITLNYYDNGIEGTNSHGSGALNGYSVTWGYNSAMQLTSLNANTASALSQSFTYDSSGRLSTVTDGSYSATYSYTSNSRLVSQILFKTNTTTRLTTTKTWDYLNRLLESRSVPSATSELPATFKYAYNNANQRISATMADDSYWIYQYDSLGQVISGDHYWSDGTPVAGQQYDYGFDDIGSRKIARFGGDASGQNLQSAIYTPSLLNQYTNRTVPAIVSVIGIASAPATVTVNSNSVYRRGEYFWKELTLTNSSASVWLSITNAAVNGTNITTATGNEYVPQTPEAFSYDADGNLTGDGRWTYSWDAENRLTRMVAATGNGPQQRLDFTYDPMGRRIRKQVWNNTTGTGTAATDLKFIYEAWNLIGEVDALNSGANVRTYLWGMDMSGSRQGAGGVGGLLSEKNASGVAQFGIFDGNGNVGGFVAGDTGAYSSTYEYGPFGETVRSSGIYASSNPIRFSSKYQDSETTLVYYGHRYYNVSTGRWASRDPVNDPGFRKGPFRFKEEKQLFAFVGNDSVDSFDPLGLAQSELDPDEQSKCKEDIQKALDILRKAINQPCGTCKNHFAKTPRCQDALQRLNNLTITIVSGSELTNCSDSKTGDEDYGYTWSTDGKWEVFVCPMACRMGRWCLAETIIHELSHECDDGASHHGKDGKSGAFDAEKACGLGKSCIRGK
jgi:RHS repeat-associated protein